MNKNVFIAENPLDLEQWQRFETEDLCAFLAEHFKEWPTSARIYHGVVNQQTDVTPQCEADIEKLQNLTGDFYVVVYPEFVFVIIAIIAVVAVAAVAFLGAPAVPTPAVRLASNRQSTSPNNELGDRTNSQRVNGRIPDIFGTVRAVPDLLAVPYKVYKNHLEIETCFMCIGKGAYDVTDVCDGDTSAQEIAGESVEIYAPFTSPNSPDSPQLQIGTPIDETVVKAIAYDSVNGQTLRAPNSNSVSGNNNIRFDYPDTIEIDTSANIDFTNYFDSSDSLAVSNSTFSGAVNPFTQTNVQVKFTYTGTIVFQTADPSRSFGVGDTLTIANASRTDGTTPVNLAGSYTVTAVNSTTVTLNNPSATNVDWNKLNSWTNKETLYGASNIGVSAGTRSGSLDGTYTVVSVSSTQIVLSNPYLVNTNWEKIDQLVNAQTSFGSAILQTSGPKWIGPFLLDVVDLNKIYCNFVAFNGLYKDDGSQQYRFDVTCELEVTPVNSLGVAIGAAQLFQATIEGSATTTATRAVTLKALPTFVGRCKVRARRVTNADLTFNGTVVDEIKWQQVYAISPVALNDFGNVTTVFSQTVGTSGALAVKERKLNMLVTRKIPLRISGSTFTTTLTATNSVDEIISFICLDPYIGNRQASEIDFDTIYAEIAKAEAYFAFAEATEFNYTFDSANLSFEESLESVANAVFCNAYRQGNQIKVAFEKSTDDSLLIFNHRNKLPATETRTINFGNQNNYDGVEVAFVNPDDDVADTYYIPADRSAINPQQVETLGVRNKMQAYIHAWRVWNKIKSQNVVTEFTATHEAALALVNSRILIADNTRPHTQDGEVIMQSGLTLTLSQDVVFTPGINYIIFLQHIDGTVESIAITPGTNLDQVVLTQAPVGAISTDIENFAKCTYVIVPDTDSATLPFMLVEKMGKEGYQYDVSAVNYSHLYYQQDRLQLWLNFEENNFDDTSPFENTVLPQGAAATINDATRDICYVGTTAASFANVASYIPTASYTKTCWINKADLTSVGNILSSTAANNENFGVDATGKVIAGHGSTKVSAALPAANVWQHVALNYDATTQKMNLYINGNKLATATAVAQRTLGLLTAFGFNGGGGFIGRASDLRLYSASLSDYEIKEIYRASVA